MAELEEQHAATVAGLAAAAEAAEGLVQGRMEAVRQKFEAGADRRVAAARREAEARLGEETQRAVEAVQVLGLFAACSAAFPLIFRCRSLIFHCLLSVFHCLPLAVH